jgi:hypothetical protein
MTFEVVERDLRLFGPREVVCFLEQPVKRECFFAELAYEAAKRCESTCQLLDMSKRPSLDCLRSLSRR